MANETIRLQFDDSSVEAGLKDLIAGFERLDKSVTGLQSRLDKGIKASNFEQLRAGAGGAANALDGIGQKAQKSSSLVGDFFKGGLLLEGFNKGVSLLQQFGGQIVDTAAKFEKLKAVLAQNFGGNRTAALEAFAQIQAFAANTPFQVDDITSAFIRFQSRGIEPTVKELGNIGDIAASTNATIEQVTEALLDVGVGQTVRLESLGVAAKLAGDKVIASFRGQTITVDQTNEGIIKLARALGETTGVAGSMATISTTLAGAISNAGDAVDNFFAGLGDTGGVLKEVVSGFTTLVTAAGEFVNQPLSQEIRAQQIEFNNLARVFTDVNTSEQARAAALSELNRLYPQYLSNVQLETLNGEALEAVLKSINIQFEKKILLAARDEFNIKNQKALTEAVNEEVEARKALERAKRAEASGEIEAVTNFGFRSAESERNTNLLVRAKFLEDVKRGQERYDAALKNGEEAQRAFDEASKTRFGKTIADLEAEEKLLADNAAKEKKRLQDIANEKFKQKPLTAAELESAKSLNQLLAERSRLQAQINAKEAGQVSGSEVDRLAKLNSEIEKIQKLNEGQDALKAKIAAQFQSLNKEDLTAREQVAQTLKEQILQIEQIRVEAEKLAAQTGKAIDISADIEELKRIATLNAANEEFVISIGELRDAEKEAIEDRYRTARESLEATKRLLLSLAPDEAAQEKVLKDYDGFFRELERLFKERSAEIGGKIELQPIQSGPERKREAQRTESQSVALQKVQAAGTVKVDAKADLSERFNASLQSIREKIFASLNITDEDAQFVFGAISDAASKSFDAFNDIFDAQIEQNDRLIESIDARIDKEQELLDEKQSSLDKELEFQAQGLANNVAFAKQEVAEEKAKLASLQVEREKALKKGQELQKKAARLQLAQDIAQQVSSTAVAVANIWAQPSSSLPFGVGAILAAIQIATLFASIAAAKKKAQSLANAGPFFKGGQLPFGKTDKHGGNGYQVTDDGREIARVGGGEFIVNEDVTREHLPFLKKLNAGGYKKSDLEAATMASASFDRRAVGRITERSNTIEVAKMTFQQAAIKEAIAEQTAHLMENGFNQLIARPHYVPVPDGYRVFEKDAYGNTRTQKVTTNAK